MKRSKAFFFGMSLTSALFVAIRLVDGNEGLTFFNAIASGLFLFIALAL